MADTRGRREELGSLAGDPMPKSGTPTRFVIVTVGRTGSSWLMEMLNSHPTIGGYGELLTPAPATTYPQTRAAMYSDPGGVAFFAASLAGQSYAARCVRMPLLGVKYLERVYAARGEFEALGFRLLYGHLKSRWRTPFPVASWLLPYAAIRRVHVIHLVRRNKLDLLVSGQVGAARRLLHARPDDDVPPATIRLDVEKLPRLLDRELEKERFAKRLLRPLATPVLQVSYEDLVSDTTLQYRRVVQFLGVDPAGQEPQWRMRKVIDTPLEETIENFDDVIRVLRGTRHAAFVEGT